MTNTVARNGLVFFPEFCDVALRKFREDDEEEFAEVMFKVSDVAKDILDNDENRCCAVQILFLSCTEQGDIRYIRSS